MNMMIKILIFKRRANFKCSSLIDRLFKTVTHYAIGGANNDMCAKGVPLETLKHN